MYLIHTVINIPLYNKTLSFRDESAMKLKKTAAKKYEII